MSLVRAFTNRRKESPLNNNIHIGRAASQRNGKPVHRAQISSPIALVSSTNALTIDAPDIAGTAFVGSRNVSSSSRTSGEESDASSMSLNTNTDASSVDNSPIAAEPNHLSCYFRASTGAQSPSRSLNGSMHDAPVIPSRVPSHSKRAHEFVHRKRSVQRLMSPPATLSRPSSSEMFAAHNGPVEAPKEGPFGNELAQLDEVQEELHHVVRDAEAEEDFSIMHSRGLAAFGANDYLSEIHDLISITFMAEAAPVWI